MRTTWGHRSQIALINQGALICPAHVLVPFAQIYQGALIYALQSNNFGLCSNFTFPPPHLAELCLGSGGSGQTPADSRGVGRLRQRPKNTVAAPGGVDKNSGGVPPDLRGAQPKLTPMKTPPELCRSFHRNYFWWSFGGALPEFLLTTPGATAESTPEASINSCRSEVAVESKSPRQSCCGVDSAYYNASHFTKTIYYVSNYNYKNSISEQQIENKLQAPTTCLRPPRTVQYWYLYYDP